MSPRKAIREGHDAGKIYPFVVVTETDLLLCLSTAIRYPLSPREALDLAASLEDGARLLTRKAGDVAPPISRGRGRTEQASTTRRFDVAEEALVSAVMWRMARPRAVHGPRPRGSWKTPTLWQGERCSARGAGRAGGRRGSRGKDSVCPTCGGKGAALGHPLEERRRERWIGRSDFFRWMGSEVSPRSSPRRGSAKPPTPPTPRSNSPAPRAGRPTRKNQP